MGEVYKSTNRVPEFTFQAEAQPEPWVAILGGAMKGSQQTLDMMKTYQEIQKIKAEITKARGVSFRDGKATNLETSMDPAAIDIEGMAAVPDAPGLMSPGSVNVGSAMSGESFGGIGPLVGAI